MIFNWTTQPEKLVAWNQQVKTTDSRGTQVWYKNGHKHRDGDLSAVNYADGTRRWYKNGQQVAKSRSEYNIWKARLENT